jgi:hypothetical protein
MNPPPPPANPPPPNRPAPVVGMKEALIVVGNADNTAGTGDEVLEQLLFDDLGFFVTILDDADDSNVAGQYGLVIISSSADQNQVQDEYLLDRQPVIVMNDQVFEEMQMVEENDGDVENDEEIEIQDQNHPIAAVLGNVSEEEVVVYNNNNDIIFGEVQGDADIIASNVGDNDEATIFIYEAGDELAEDDDNNTRDAPNRRMGFFVSEEALNDDDVNASGEALLEAALIYTWNGTGNP